MKFQAKNFKLKNGKEIVIRQAELDDAENLLKAAKSYISDSEHILLTPEEFNPTIEQEAKWIKSYIDKPNNLLLVACYKDQIIGNIDLSASSREKIKHTACIGMSIISQWRGLGAGKILLDSVISWARHNPNLYKIWLEVFENNEAGRALYKKCGFIEEGRQAKFIKIGENKFVDNIIMGLEIK